MYAYTALPYNTVRCTKNQLSEGRWLSAGLPHLPPHQLPAVLGAAKPFFKVKAFPAHRVCGETKVGHSTAHAVQRVNK